METYLDTPWHMIPSNIKGSDKIAPFFYLGDLIKSEVATRRGIDNNFEIAAYMRNAVFLARNILSPIQDHYGSLVLNSVYRSQHTERALKNKPNSWVSRSQHSIGQAADIEVSGVSNLMLAEWIKRNLEFDHLILECHDKRQGPNSGWVHVSVVAGGPNRGLLQSYIRTKKGFHYVSGLTTT